MSSLPVLAEAQSKLHADIALIRLLRAGVRAERISAVFPRNRAPNTVCCWLKSFQPVPLNSTLPVAAAGLLGRIFGQGKQPDDVDQQLEKLGFTADMSTRLIEKVEDGRIVLCVHARNETEVAIAWHVFQHVSAEPIMSLAEQREFAPREMASTAPHWAIAAA